jgi:hypothetical protein
MRVGRAAWLPPPYRLPSMIILAASYISSGEPISPVFDHALKFSVINTTHVSIPEVPSLTPATIFAPFDAPFLLRPCTFGLRALLVTCPLVQTPHVNVTYRTSNSHSMRIQHA